MKVLLINIIITAIVSSILYVLYQKLFKKKVVYKDLIKIIGLVIVVTSINYFTINYMITNKIATEEDFITGKPAF